ncbi:MAG: hypothetical protein Mars2KO_25330 [Maribacter sp.]
MKKLIILIVAPFLLTAQAEKSIGTENTWLTDYDKAIAKAENEDKNVLVYFTGSDWCAPCKMLKKDFFDTSTFQTISQNYLLLYIDIPMNRSLISAEQLKHNKELSSRLNRKNSVPLLTILNSEGKELGAYAGYNMNGGTKKHIALLKKFQ